MPEATISRAVSSSWSPSRRARDFQGRQVLRAARARASRRTIWPKSSSSASRLRCSSRLKAGLRASSLSQSASMTGARRKHSSGCAGRRPQAPRRGACSGPRLQTGQTAKEGRHPLGFAGDLGGGFAEVVQIGAGGGAPSHSRPSASSTRKTRSSRASGQVARAAASRAYTTRSSRPRASREQTQPCPGARRRPTGRTAGRRFGHRRRTPTAGPAGAAGVRRSWRCTSSGPCARQQAQDSASRASCTRISSPRSARADGCSLNQSAKAMCEARSSGTSATASSSAWPGAGPARGRTARGWFRRSLPCISSGSGGCGSRGPERRRRSPGSSRDPCRPRGRSWWSGCRRAVQCSRTTSFGWKKVRTPLMDTSRRWARQGIVPSAPGEGLKSRKMAKSAARKKSRRASLPVQGVEHEEITSRVAAQPSRHAARRSPCFAA